MVYTRLPPQPCYELPLELVDFEAVLVERHRNHLGLEAAEGHDRAQIRRPFDHHDVAAVEERLADKLERLDRAARDQQLVVGGTPALQDLEPAGERVERSGEPAGRRVLEGARLARGGELLDERGGALARERQRVGEAARERDHAGEAEERENRGDPFAHVAARARCKERLPAPRLRRHRHSPTIEALLLLEDCDHVGIRREPKPHAQLRLHHLGSRVQRAEERHLDLVVRDLRHDHVRIELEERQQPVQLGRVGQSDTQAAPRVR
jgi:hypothetical protein